MIFTERLVIHIKEDIEEGYSPAQYSRFTKMYLASTISVCFEQDRICSGGISVSLDTKLKIVLNASDLYIRFDLNSYFCNANKNYTHKNSTVRV